MLSCTAIIKHQGSVQGCAATNRKLSDVRDIQCSMGSKHSGLDPLDPKS